MRRFLEMKSDYIFFDKAEKEKLMCKIRMFSFTSFSLTCPCHTHVSSFL